MRTRAQVSVKVMLVEMGKEVEVQVRSTMAVLNVISKAAEAGDARLDVSSTLFEASEHLEIGIHTCKERSGSVGNN